MPPAERALGTAAADRPAQAAASVRRLDLDRAKGVAILLVVFGHIVAREPPVGVEWYDQVRYLIYRFHMPFFLYLSGYVAWLTGAALTPFAAVPGLLRRRAERLLLPFLLFGLFVLLGKLVAARLLHVDNAPAGLLEGLRDLVWTTGESPATMVWFLWALFLSSALAPLLVPRIGLAGFVALGFALSAAELPAIAYLDKFGRHFLFFALGCLAAAREARWLPLFERWLPFWWAAFALSLLAAHLGWIGEWWSLVACGAAAIPALHGAMRLPPLATASWPLFFGRHSMAIYLLNTVAIGLAKALLLAAGVGWTAPGFLVHAPALALAGVFLPILLKTHVLRRVPALDRMTR
jgi:uncharacterized membrane protein YcfT